MEARDDGECIEPSGHCESNCKFATRTGELPKRHIFFNEWHRTRIVEVVLNGRTARPCWDAAWQTQNKTAPGFAASVARRWRRRPGNHVLDFARLILCRSLYRCPSSTP